MAASTASAAATAAGDSEWLDKAGKPYPFSRQDFNMFFWLDHPEEANDNLDRLAEIRASGTEPKALQVTRGALPADLVGDYFLNGPACIKLGGKVCHPFDGHGFLRRVRIDGAAGTAALSADVVGTAAFKKESAARALVYRGLGTLPRDPTTLAGKWHNTWASLGKSVANTCVVKWGGNLLALWEGGPPHRVAEDDFSQADVYTFDGAIPRNVPFLAHTCFDAKRNRLVGVNLHQGRTTGFTFFEIDEQNQLLSKVSRCSTAQARPPALCWEASCEYVYSVGR